MKYFTNNSDLSTSPGTTEESPGSSISNKNKNHTIDFNFKSKYERLKKMINNVILVLGEYHMNNEIRTKKKLETDSLIQKLESLKSEWDNLSFNSAEKTLAMLEKAVKNTKCSIMKISRIQESIDSIEKQVLEEKNNWNEEFEQSKDLELDVEYLLLKLTCKKQNELLEEYQKKIRELKNSCTTLISVKSDSVSNKKLTKIQTNSQFNNENNNISFTNRDDQIEENYYVRSILGERNLTSENDQIIELLKMENDIQSDIISHISKVIGISL